jgi:K+/H+ antiporter YhaU regulatory subunit KhtT
VQAQSEAGVAAILRHGLGLVAPAAAMPLWPGDQVLLAGVARQRAAARALLGDGRPAAPEQMPRR